MAMNTVKKELFWFLTPTFIITYGLGVIAYFKGGLDHFPLMTISMYVPALMVLLLYLFKFKKPVFKNNDIGLRFSGFKFWIIAPFLLFILVAISYFIPYIFKNNFFLSTELILEETQKTGVGVGNWLFNLIIIFGINTLIAPLINILMFLGEEIGWRAFLVPRLLRLFNPKISFIIGGSIWGIWHGAAILMGFNYPNHPFIGIIMMMILCIPIGIILQYLYFKSKSIFVAAIAHGAMNWTSGNFIMFVLSDKNYNTFIFGPTGIIGIVIFCISAYFIFNRIDWQKENTYFVKDIN
jgi:uncharacterized protein